MIESRAARGEPAVAADRERVTPLRIGFLVQFLLIVAWTLTFIAERAGLADAVQALGVFGGLHLALVAMFTVTEDLVVPRRAAAGACSASSRWRWLLALFRPAADAAALYVLVQMVLLLAVAVAVPAGRRTRCVAGRRLRVYLLLHRRATLFVYRARGRPRHAALQLRVASCCCLPLRWCCRTSCITCSWQPDVLDLAYSAPASRQSASGRWRTGLWSSARLVSGAVLCIGVDRPDRLPGADAARHAMTAGAGRACRTSSTTGAVGEENRQ